MSSDLCRRRLHEEHLWAASDQVHLPSTKRGGDIVAWKTQTYAFVKQNWETLRHADAIVLQVRQRSYLELLSLEDKVLKDEWLSMYGGAAHCV